MNIGCVQQNVYFATVGSFLHADWVMLLKKEDHGPISADNYKTVAKLDFLWST